MEIAVLIRESPFRSNRVSELLRMSVGLTIADGNNVSLFFLGDGVKALGPGNPEEAGMKLVEKHLKTLVLLKRPLYVIKNDSPAAETNLRFETRELTETEFARRLAEFDRTIG